MTDNTGVFPSFPLDAPSSSAQRSNRFQGAFPDPYLDYASTQMPRSIYDVFRWAEYCFPPGALVTAAGGRLKRIEDIRVDDIVINRFGVPARVVATSAREYSGETVQITLKDSDQLPLNPTVNHNVFMVRTAKLKPGRVQVALSSSAIQKMPAGDLRAGDYLVTPVSPLDGSCTPTVDPWIAGLYLGNGWPICRGSTESNEDGRGMPYAIRWCNRPKGDISGELVRRLGLRSLHATLTKMKGSGKGVSHTCHDQDFTRNLLELFGRGSRGKFIDTVVFHWSREDVLQLIAGYVDSDGHVHTKEEEARGIGITSVNLNLLVQVRDLCYSAGLTPTLRAYEYTSILPGNTSKEYSGKIYSLFFNRYEFEDFSKYCIKLKGLSFRKKTRGRTASVVLRDGYAFRRILKVERTLYEGPVHNFQVEGEHSYLVNSCAVSNCFLTYGTYRMAMQRVVRYFLTKIELTDASDDEKEKYEEFIDEHIHLMEHLAESGDNYVAYGNEFISIHVPFRRHLRCPKCKTEKPIGHWQYRWSDFQFHSKCGNCDYDGQVERVDRRSIEQDKLRIIHWSPHELRIVNHPITGDTIYFWEIPPNIRGYVERGNEFYLEYTPWEFITAIKERKLFKFHKDVLYHMKTETLAGVREFGWGIPQIMGNFKQAWYIQVLKRYNEAIALDYIIPFRVVTPAPGTSREADPLLHMNLSLFNSKVLSMFRMHRRDPTMIHALPFPVNMQLLGAEGKNLSPQELLDSGTDEFLNAQGIPAELYRGSLEWQALPAALRLFERTWISLVSALNREINWVFKRCSDLQNWENLKGRLQPVTLADDLDRKHALLQLSAGQQISRQTAWAPFNLNFREEIKRMFEEQQYTDEQTARFQEEMAKKMQLQNNMQMGSSGQAAPGGAGAPAAAGQGAPPQGGADPSQGGMQPAPAGTGMPSQMVNTAGASVEDLAYQAEQMAYQLLAMPYELRKSELLKIKRSNETLHSLVVSKMEKIRGQAQTQGGYAMLQQTLGGGATAQGGAPAA